MPPPERNKTLAFGPDDVPKNDDKPTFLVETTMTTTAAAANTPARFNERKGGDMQNLHAIQKPHESLPGTNGKLVDPTGHTLPPAVKLTAMARLDQAASQQVTLSRGSIWLLATGLVLAGVIFSYGSSILTWARDDQSTRERLLQTQRDVEESRRQIEALNAKFDEIQKSLIKQRVKDAETRAKTQGYQLGVTETQADKGKRK